MAVAPWVVSDELWKRFTPLLPKQDRRFRYPGRKRLPNRQALQGILFVLHIGIAWRHLPLELGFGSGSTCWRRLDVVPKHVGSSGSPWRLSAVQGSSVPRRTPDGASR